MASNKGVQGTAHKVRRPLNRDIRDKEMKTITTVIIAFALGTLSIARAQSGNIQIEWGYSTGAKQWALHITPTNVLLLQTLQSRNQSAEHTVTTNVLVECPLTPIQFRVLSSNIQSSGIYTVGDRIDEVPILPAYFATRDGEVLTRCGGRWDGWFITLKADNNLKRLHNSYANEYLSLCKAVGMIDPIIKQEVSTAIEWLVGDVTRVAQADPGSLQTNMEIDQPEQAGPGCPPQGALSPDP